MKRIVRIVSLALVFSLLMAVPAYAIDNRAMEASNYFSYTSAYLSKVSGTTFHICFHVTGTGTMDEIGVSYIQLQESSDDTNWSPVASYYNLVDTDASFYASHVTYTGTANKYYRAYVEYYAMDDTGTGHKFYTTASIKVP